MAVDRVESFRAYRDTLQRRFDQASHAELEKVPGGEWDGMEVLTRKTLEDVIHRIAEADPEPLATVAELRTPGRVFVDAFCPRCDLPTRILVEVGAEVVTSLDGSEIRVKTKAKAQSHTCGQLAIEPLGVSDDEQMTIGSLVGPTEPTLILRHDMPRPDDVVLERPADERCGAEIEVPTDQDGLTELLLCERLIDHDTPENVTVLGEDAREHWAEGGFGWHFEERPVPAGIEGGFDPTTGEELGNDETEEDE